MPSNTCGLLLVEAIAEAKSEIATDLDAATQAKSERRLQALQIVQFKLDKLEQHLKTSSRLLNDLRTLRRLLLDERAADPDKIQPQIELSSCRRLELSAIARLTRLHAFNFSANFFSSLASFGEITNMQ
jgi:flavin-dependent dehydrogenase